MEANIRFNLLILSVNFSENIIMKRRICFLLFLLSSFLIFSQTSGTTAKGAFTAATNMNSIEEAVSYLKKTSAAMKSESEKRTVLTILAEIQEQLGNYDDAQKNYAAAAGMKGSAQSSAGVPNKTSEQLVLDAIRCALNAGDYETAQNYLNSSVRNSKDENVAAYVKLYEQWAALCKAGISGDVSEPAAILKAYSTLDSMKSVRPSILLTLWHLTGESEYSDKLKKDFPKSMEAAVAKGEVQILPSPFWYFVPKSGSDLPDVDIENIADSSSSKSSDSSANSPSSSGEKIVKEQLGLFRDKANAQRLFDKVKEKGFSPEIDTETRPSGTTYYIVIVRENKEGTIGKQLRTVGFDCYPVFD